MHYRYEVTDDRNDYDYSVANNTANILDYYLSILGGTTTLFKKRQGSPSQVGTHMFKDRRGESFRPCTS
jgi:hypothetical protein